MVKVMFMVYRKAGVTHDQCVTEWMGAQHLSSLDESKAAGLRRYVQNAVTGDQREGAPDGVGELWFDDAATMDRVLSGAAGPRCSRMLRGSRTLTAPIP